MLQKFSTIVILVSLMAISGCKKNNPVDCVAITITASSNLSYPCVGEGSISITSPTGADWSYKTGSSSFQPMPQFSLLKPGDYTITAKNSDGCQYNQVIKVNEKTAGPLFAAVKSLLQSSCVSCHSGNNPQAGLNWTSSCDILTYWDRIKARAVDGNPSPMPQAGLLPQSERNKIIDWINSGHRYTD